MKPQVVEKGFSLIEVIIAMAIFSIGAGGLYAMQLTSANGNTRANQQTGAVAAATLFTEQLMHETFANLSGTTVVNQNTDLSSLTISTGFQGSLQAVFARKQYVQSVQWTVINVGPAADGIKQIALQVSYTGGRNGTRTVDLNFLRIRMIL